MPWHLILRRLLLKMSKRSLNHDKSNLQLRTAFNILSLLPKVLVNICRRSGVGGKDITEEKKVSYLSALVTLLQVPTNP